MKTIANLNNPSKIKTNSALDSLLMGGIEKRNITQFYGPPGSGKTNIALTLAVQVAREGKKVAYIDTEGGISIDRIKQLAKDDFDKVSNNIIVLEPDSLEKQTEDLRKIEAWVRSNPEEVDLIVLDSAVAMYRLNEGRSKASNKELGVQMWLLSRLSRKYDVAVVITNQIYATFEDEKATAIKPVGGTILMYWSKIILELDKSDEEGKRIATLKRHKNSPEGKSTTFKITNDGIE